MSPMQIQRSVGGGSTVRRAELGRGHATNVTVGQTMVALDGIDTLLAVMSGVDDAKAGRVYDLGSFAQYAEDDK